MIRSWPHSKKWYDGQNPVAPGLPLALFPLPGLAEEHKTMPTGLRSDQDIDCTHATGPDSWNPLLSGLDNVQPLYCWLSLTWGSPSA